MVGSCVPIRRGRRFTTLLVMAAIAMALGGGAPAAAGGKPMPAGGKPMPLALSQRSVPRPTGRWPRLWRPIPGPGGSAPPRCCWRPASS
jgi:hypothetical protein